MRLRYESEQNYRVWCHRLLRATWLCLGVVIAANMLLLLAKTEWGRAEAFSGALLRQVVWPGLINAALLAMTHLVSIVQIRKKHYFRQAFLYIACVSVTCASYVWINAGVEVMPALFILPILLAVVYIDRRVMALALLCNLLMLAAFAGLAPRWMEGVQVEQENIWVTAVLLLVVFLISNVIFQRKKELAEQVFLANRKARMDSLTGLYNHAVFYEHLDQYILRQMKKNRPFSLVIFDIDNFKKINDQYGHDVGDDVIRVLVACIKAQLPMDSQAFRYGGEEFAMLIGGKLPHCIAIVEAVLLRFRMETIEQMGFPVTVSAGVCPFDPAIFNGRREFFSAADEALYAAKHQGKNRYVLWEGVQGYMET